ncbi:hypothetical protein GmHk_01G001179 [Glycine max]|nr:hypothetical protein GmHk_01G001179 [Glycine max]
MCHNQPVLWTCLTWVQHFLGINHPTKEWRKEVEEKYKNLQEAWSRKVEEENKCSLEIIKQELKEAIKIELSQIASQHSPPVEAPDIQVLVTRVSTKGSCVEANTNPLGKEPSDVHVDNMGLVGVVKVYDSDTQVLFLMSEIKFVRHVVGIFMGWLTHIVKPVFDEDSQKGVSKLAGPTEMTNVVDGVDPLGELVKNLFDVYQKPIELPWDGMKFGTPNVKDGFFITHVDVTEIILGEKCLNISILQLWMMFMNDWSTSLGYDSVYDFLEPQSI